MSAAVSAVIVALAAAATMSWTGGDQDEPVAKSFTTHGDIEVEPVADFTRARSIVTFAHLPALPPGQEYSTGAIRDGVWLKMGPFRANANGWWSGEFAFRMQPGDSLCLTGGAPTDSYQIALGPLFVEPL